MEIEEMEKQEELSRRDFFLKAGWVSLGVVGASLIIPGETHAQEKLIPRERIGDPGIGVSYRVKEIKGTHSACEVAITPRAQSLIEYHTKSRITYQPIEGEHIPQGVVLAIDKAGKVLTPGEARNVVEVEPKLRHALKNPSQRPLRLLQRYEPAWNSDGSFYQVGRRLIPGADVWFELRDSPDQTKPGLKWRIIKYIPNESAIEGVRVDPGVESLVEYCKESRITLTVTDGKGIILLDGESKEIDEGTRLTIDPGTKFQLKNPFKERWELVREAIPDWRPDDSFYMVNGKVIPGTDIWFSVRLA